LLARCVCVSMLANTSKYGAGELIVVCACVCV